MRLTRLIAGGVQRNKRMRPKGVLIYISAFPSQRSEKNVASRRNPSSHDFTEKNITCVSIPFRLPLLTSYSQERCDLTQ